MPKRAPRIDLDTFVSYRLAVLSAAWGAASGRFYRERFDLALREWRVLAVLSKVSDEDGEASASDLARLSGVEKAGVSRALAALARRRLVSSVVSRVDARRILVSLTEKGRVLIDRLAPEALARQGALVAIFSATERATFFALIEKLERRVAALNLAHLDGKPKSVRTRRPV